MRPISSPSHAVRPATLVGWLFSGWRLWALIVATLLLVYGPSLRGEFLWDDRPGHVTQPGLQSWDGLRRIWFEVGATQQYYPVLHTAFWIEHRLWGDATLGYRLMNVLLHATAAGLFAAVLRRLMLRGAILAAWLFALHPVCVESVAWISEQKNTLSAVLYLAAGLAYLRFERARKPRDYALATMLFLGALLTKTVTASLPAALLVLGWWRRGRLSWRDDVRPLLPWFALSLAGGLLTAWFEHELIGARGAEFDRSLLERCLLPGRVIGFYLAKLIWPANLSFIYPRWSISPDDPVLYFCTAFVVAGLGGLWAIRHRARGPIAAVLLFVGTLFPVLGFVNVYPFRYAFVADHFQYLACLAPVAAAAAWLSGCFTSRRGLMAGGLVVTAFAALTSAQSACYRDPLALYGATVARNPQSWMVHNNLAEALAAAGRPADAIPHLEETLRLKPDSAEAENNLGDDLRRLNRPTEAILHLRRALELRPNYAEAHNNLGVALMAMGELAAGKAEFAAALRLNPRFPLARFNLGLACAKSGDVAAAAQNFEAAVALQPNYAEAELDWAIALLLSRDFAAAAPHFERAMQLEPHSATAHHSFGRALEQAGRFEDAIAEFRKAVELEPNLAVAHAGLAHALRQVGRDAEAAVHDNEATRRGARP